MKKIFIFLSSFLLFLIPSFFIRDFSFFDQLNLPFFALPKPLYGIVWTILYFLISISISIIYHMYQFKYIPDYNKALISNYIFNELFTYLLFYFKQLFFSFIIALGNFITSLFLYYETKSLDKKAANFLLPYVFFNLFVVVLSLTIYFMNL